MRKDDRDSDNGCAVTDPQAKALITWCATPDPEHAILRAIRQPTLVASGSHDTMLPAKNAYAMFKALSNAQLILYPGLRARRPVSTPRDIRQSRPDLPALPPGA